MIKNKNETILQIIKYILLIIMLIIVLFPFLWLFVSSFKYEKNIISYPPTIFASKYTLKSYIRIFSTIPMALYLKNTIIFTVGASSLALLFDSASGYAFARLKFKGKNKLFMFILITMMIPFQVMMMPLFLEVHYLGMLNTYWGLILPRATSAFGIFMMCAYFSVLPKDLEEAARIDGLNEIGIFFKIMLPLVKPGLLTLAIFHIMNNWNDLLYPLIMTSDPRMRTLSAGLALFVGDRATTYYGPQLAGAVISMLPLLILYAIFQKSFVSSVASSGIKG